MIHFLTHPEVLIDPAIPIPDWPLSPAGTARSRQILHRPWLTKVQAIFTSAERKARDTADLIAHHRALTPIIIPTLGENDRSATGYLPRPEFEATADQFFAHPHASIRGWERAIDAQSRIIAAVETVIASAPQAGDTLIVAHGGVGALLLCHLKQIPISRTEDQPGDGGGNVFTFQNARLLSGWRPMEALP